MKKAPSSAIRNQQPLRALMVDDSEDDVLLIIRELKKGGYNPLYERVETAAAMKKALKEKPWDIILCDYKMPKFNAPSAITLLKETNIDIPLIIISGTIGEETAIECMRLGAHDYFMKSKLSRLCPAIARELEDVEIRNKQKQAEEKLRKSEANYRQLFDNSPAGIYQIDYKNGRFLKANDVFCEYAGCSQEEITSLSPYDILTEESKKLFWERMEKISQGLKVPEIVEFEILNKKGKRFYIQLHIKNIYDAEGNVVAADVIAHDITERKRAENALEESEVKYRNIFENAIEGIYQATNEGQFITVNTAFARMAGYDSPEELIESIKDIGSQLYVNPEDRKRFLKIRKTKGFVNNFEVEFYRKDRSTFWVVINARAVKDERGKIIYTEGLIEDITLRKQTEEQLHQSLDRLKKAINTTIHVLISALEARDPYTAGHQSRTANLACAIAKDMKLDEETMNGIRMAGVIHDIGKLSIPVEILSKPTKLTDLEFSLIKEHSQSGFEMLKDVESDSPLAEIVHQHHERMNGSGYPRNLKGNEILLEARILAVADVVEAMASHRPYRASLGIKAALEEIEKNKGILYDVEVVNSCLKLFREKAYVFK